MQQTLEQLTSGAVDGLDGPPTTQLVRVLREEVAILEELRAVLARQRQGVAANDHHAIEASVREIGRALLTLEEARRGRQALVAMLCGREVESLTDLESWFPGVPEDLIAAADAVRASAASAASDLALNQHVLDRALQAGDAFLQRLFSGGADSTPPDTVDVVCAMSRAVTHRVKTVADEIGTDHPQHG